MPNLSAASVCFICLLYLLTTPVTSYACGKQITSRNTFPLNHTMNERAIPIRRLFKQRIKPGLRNQCESIVLQECVLCLANLLQLSCICVACESMLNIGAQSVRSCLATSANCTGAWEKLNDKLPFATSGISPIRPYRIKQDIIHQRSLLLPQQMFIVLRI